LRLRRERAMRALEPIKLYFDYKSPYAYLAMQPAFALPGRFSVDVRWLPYLLRIKGRGERSVASEWKVRYSYLDARRAANRRGGFLIRGPRKVYDSTPALIGALFAQRAGFFQDYTAAVFSGFFEHRLEIDDPQAIAALLEGFGAGAEDYRSYLAGEGARAFEACIAEGERDQIFGVPIFVFRGEPFWGQDRIGLLEERLREEGLAL
jgi:2-hydroxychromene-2-carboxylate isomerase